MRLNKHSNTHQCTSIYHLTEHHHQHRIPSHFTAHMHILKLYSQAKSTTYVSQPVPNNAPNIARQNVNAKKDIQHPARWGDAIYIYPKSTMNIMRPSLCMQKEHQRERRPGSLHTRYVRGVGQSDRKITMKLYAAPWRKTRHHWTIASQQRWCGTRSAFAVNKTPHAGAFRTRLLNIAPPLV